MKKKDQRKSYIFSKLRSEKGASLVIAYAIFLVAAIISLSLISIGMTSLKLSSAQMEDEQAYLAVSSAMRVFEGELDSIVINAEQNADDDGNFPNSPFAGSVSFSADNGESDSFVSALIKILQKSGSTSFTIKSPDEEHIAYDVEVKIAEAVDSGIFYETDEGEKAVEYVIDVDFSSESITDAHDAEYSKSTYYYPYFSEEIFYGTKIVNDKVVEKPIKRVTKVTWKAYRK